MNEDMKDGMIRTTQQNTANTYNDKERIIHSTDYVEANLQPDDLISVESES